MMPRFQKRVFLLPRQTGVRKIHNVAEWQYVCFVNPLDLRLVYLIFAKNPRLNYEFALEVLI